MAKIIGGVTSSHIPAVGNAIANNLQQEPYWKRFFDGYEPAKAWLAKHKPDLVIVPIGGHFVMSPQDAAFATREWIKPKYALPVHYGTIPQLKGTPEEYVQALGSTSTKVFPIKPGDKIEF